MSLQSFASSSTSFALRSLRIGAAPTLVRGKKDKKAPPKAAPTRQKGPPPDLGLGSSQNDIIKAVRVRFSLAAAETEAGARSRSEGG